MFPILQGKALKEKDPEVNFETKRRVIEIAFNLFSSESEKISQRIKAKLLESSGENLLKCLEFRQEISRSISELMKTKHLIFKALDIEHEDSEEAAEALRQKSLDRGYLELLQIDSMFWQMAQTLPDVGQLFSDPVGVTFTGILQQNSKLRKKLQPA